MRRDQAVGRQTMRQERVVTTTASDKIGWRMSHRKQAADEGSGNDHPNSDAPIPANVVVALSDVFTDKSVDMSGNERGFMGGEGGFNSVNSYYHGKQWVPWNVIDQVCSFGLEVSDFFIAICMLQFFIAICILQHAICMQYAYCDAI